MLLGAVQWKQRNLSEVVPRRSNICIVISGGGLLWAQSLPPLEVDNRVGLGGRTEQPEQHGLLLGGLYVPVL